MSSILFKTTLKGISKMEAMVERAKTILGWIDARKKRCEITKCVFSITTPKINNIYNDKTIKKIEEMLKRNNVNSGCFDTISSSWNLNRDWVVTDEIDCIVEYCGVYPVNWCINDVVELERMETEGEIIILVDWIVDGEYVPNH